MNRNMDAVANMNGHPSLIDISSESSNTAGLNHAHINMGAESVMNINANMCDIDDEQVGFSCSETVNNYMDEFMVDESIFTQEDLYSVVDPSTADAGIAEIEDDPHSHWTSQSFIPLHPDAKQIHGGEVRSCADASTNFQSQYYHVMVNDNRTAASIENIQGVNTGAPTNVQPSPRENEVPSSNTEVDSVGSLEAVPMKVRKPRGRKPKAVKEREAAEAAAAEKNVDISNKRTLRERDRTEAVPTVVLHHKAGQNSQSIDNPTPQLSLVNHENSIRNKNYPTNQLSLEKLAFQDRSAILARRNDANDGNLSGSSTNVSTTSYQDSGPIQHAQATRINQESFAPGDMHTNLSLRSNGYISRVPYQIPSGSSRLALNGVAPGSQANVFNNVTQQYTDQHSNNNRLDQLVSSRISNIGGTKKPIVTPSYIQRNMGLYNQLTAPKKHSDFESRKFTQEKWMQYPNPSILTMSEDNHSPQQIIVGGDNGPNRMANQVFNNNPIQKHDGSASNFSNGARSNSRDLNGNSGITVGIPIAGNMQRNAIRTGHYNPNNIGLGLSNNDASTHGYSQNMFPRFGNTGPVRINNSLLFSNQIKELSYEKHILTQDNYELKVRLHSQMKLNKQLMLRLKYSYEENEVLKSQIGLRETLPNSLFSQMDCRHDIMRRKEGHHNPYQYNVDSREILRDAWILNQFKKEASNSIRRDGFLANANDNNINGSAVGSAYLSNIFDEVTGNKMPDHTADILKRSLQTSPVDVKRLRLKDEKFQVEHAIPNANGRTNYDGVHHDYQEKQKPSDSAGLCVVSSASETQVIGSLKIENEKADYLEKNFDPVPNNVSPKSAKSTNTAETEEVTDNDFGENSTSTTFNSPVNVGATANVFMQNNFCFEGTLRG